MYICIYIYVYIYIDYGFKFESMNPAINIEMEVSAMGHPSGWLASA